MDLRHIPADWSYRDLPDWARQSVEGALYHRYCSWLADYLLTNNFQLNRVQQGYAETLDKLSPAGIAISLGDTLGFLIWDRERLEEHARQGTANSAVEREKRGLWQQSYFDDPGIAEPFDDCKTPEEDYLRICEETKEADRIAEELPHADIGIRPLLSLAVKMYSTKQEAEKIIKLFYDTYNESASK